MFAGRKGNTDRNVYVLVLSLYENSRTCYSCIDICKVPKEVMKTEAKGRVCQHLPKDVANINVLGNSV